MRLFLKHSITVLAFAICLVANGQVKFTATASQTKVGKNEAIQVQFAVNAEASNFKAPSFSGFRVEQGPSRYIQQSNYNGRVSLQLSYTYVVRPTQTGVLTIGAASIDAGGETYTTQPLSITVTEKSPRANDPNDPYSIAARSAFVKVIPTKTTVYLGEPFTTYYKLYFNSDVGRYQIPNEPDYEGFFKEDIPQNRIDVKEDQYNGTKYNSALLKQFVLIAQRSGTFKPGSLEAILPTQIVYRRRYRTIEQTSTDNFPTVTVKPLPEKGKPSNFAGAVGDYKFEVSVSRNELSASESVTLKISLSGSGNIKLIDAPKPSVPNAFEVYDPELQDQIKVNGSGMSGSKTYEYLLIPRYGGTYKIPPMSFSYFDPRRERYETITSEELQITVTGGAAQPAGEGGIAAAETEKVGFIGKDILFIKTNAGSFTKKGQSFLGSTFFYTMLGISGAAFAGMLGYFFLVYNRQKDYRAERSMKASKLARKHLAKAKKELDNNNKEGFYLALTSALWGYFSDKFSIPNSKLTKELIEEKLLEKGLGAETTARLMEMMNRAEMARFTSTASFIASKDYEDTALLITQIDKEV